MALANPQFSNPELGKLDLRSKTFDGEAKQFERYEWYVARLVYVLDAAMRLAPHPAMAAGREDAARQSQALFRERYYAKQDYLKHYSVRMRKMIQQQRAA